MPQRTDIQTVLILGAGPIIIGQGCEFDYSGTQACRALQELGYRVVLINSNPATVMTDPAIADATYVEPLTWQTVERVIQREKPDAILPTMGGQTALNIALQLHEKRVLEQHNVQLIGAQPEAIEKAENRQLFSEAMQEIGLQTPNSGIATTMAQCYELLERFGTPCVIRPSFTLGGSGGGIAYNVEDFDKICHGGLELSPIQQLQIDESLLGWKEFEMEVIRDSNDNAIVICSIENFDPMGVHTGDSITVAPAQTLTDKELQIMRDAALAIIRKIGVETGGSNVQFAIHPQTGVMVVIEMNPRVSRSSALASKATGYPIAKVAAQLAVGLTLEEIDNAITSGRIPASFEPTLDYVVTKIPRFAFEKFPHSSGILSTHMQSVGEVMAIGSTFAESLQKALRSLENGKLGLLPIGDGIAENGAVADDVDRKKIITALAVPTEHRIRYIGDALRIGLSVKEIYKESHVDPWFLYALQHIINLETQLRTAKKIDMQLLLEAKKLGFADQRIAAIRNMEEQQVRSLRQQFALHPVYKRIDTCAGEFDVDTAYMYSTYQQQCEARPSDVKKIIVLGGGPNRIGQGLEFDYCCVHAALTLRECGYQTIMVNCNPETVSTDFDISDRLYFDPVTLEDVLEIIRIEQPTGVIVQFGGQTPLNIAQALEAAGVPILGVQPRDIALAEDREAFQNIIQELQLLQPINAIARTVEQAQQRADAIGYPLVVRPSFVLGGRAMEVVYNAADLAHYMHTAVQVTPGSPILLDKFLHNAIEVDVDAISDGVAVTVCAVMEHIEPAGVHSGDSSCSIPVHTLSAATVASIVAQTSKLALRLHIVGVLNIQFAVQGDDVYVLEVNPRASRTIPYVSKATGVSVINIATRVMLGSTLQQLNFIETPKPLLWFVKEVTLPFRKFYNVDPVLGPEMRSTGEVMGVGSTYAEAFGKALLAVSPDTQRIFKQSPGVLLSVRNADKAAGMAVAKELIALGCVMYATRGTQEYLQRHDVAVELVHKIFEGTRPNTLDAIKNRDVWLLINTTSDRASLLDSENLRKAALRHNIQIATTIEGARAIASALANIEQGAVRSLQEIHRGAL